LHSSSSREWSAERDDWVVLHPGDVIEDPALLLPIPALALIDEIASMTPWRALSWPRRTAC
jgi:hypothetical protein